MKRRRWRSPLEAKFKGYWSKLLEANFRRILRHFSHFSSAHFSALDGAQFLLCVVEGPGVGASAQALAMYIRAQCTVCIAQRLWTNTFV